MGMILVARSQRCGWSNDGQAERGRANRRLLRRVALGVAGCVLATTLATAWIASPRAGLLHQVDTMHRQLTAQKAELPQVRDSAHNSRLLAHVGEFVRVGEVVSDAGSSGRSTGPHVHFEVWHDGKLMNPLAFARQ